MTATKVHGKSDADACLTEMRLSVTDVVPPFAGDNSFVQRALLKDTPKLFANR